MAAAEPVATETTELSLMSFTSTVWPVRAVPVLVAAVQVNVSWATPSAVATGLVGVVGTDHGLAAADRSDHAPWPAAFTAATRKV